VRLQIISMETRRGDQVLFKDEEVQHIRRKRRKRRCGEEGEEEEEEKRHGEISHRKSWLASLQCGIPGWFLSG
jgi:hypothetical protein